MRVLLTGGGSGGHFFPLIAVAREMRRIGEENRILDIEFFYAGPRGYDDALFREDIVPLKISVGKIRRYFSLKNVTDIFRTWWGILQAFWNLFVLMPDLIFSKGGYASFPVLFVARIYRIPIIIHESDAIPGLVNRWSGKFAKRIGIAFESALRYFPKEKTALVGVPIRKRILGGASEPSREHLSVFSAKPVILVLGGSQGAEAINQMILSGLNEFIGSFEIIHQTGSAQFPDISQQSSVILSSEVRGLYHPFPFLGESQMRDALGACNFVVARAGASTIYEIAAAGKPSLLIPLPTSAQNHQRANAYEYAKTSGALIIEQNNATPNLVHHAISRIFESPEEIRKMAEGAQRFARIDSAEVIAREILSLALKH